jgi:uncharacterized membrane protein YdjX (TVP38/TMEM64 family)
MSPPERIPLATRRARLKAAHWIVLGVFLGCAIAAFYLVTQANIPWDEPQQWMQQLSDLGWIGVVFFITFLAMAIVIGPIPSTPFTIASGAIWGPNLAALYGVIGIFLGSIIAYFIGRILGRSAVKALTGKAVYFSTHRGETYLGWVIMITHMIPIMPYELISYGAGISRLSFSLFSITALLGIIPCTLMLTHMGAALTLNLWVAGAIALTIVTVVAVLAWGAKKHNCFGLKEVVSFH